MCEGYTNIGFLFKFMLALQPPSHKQNCSSGFKKKNSLCMHINFFWWVGGEGLEGYGDGVVVDNFGISMTVQMVL